jgi:hypothetical protein
MLDFPEREGERTEIMTIESNYVSHLDKNFFYTNIARQSYSFCEFLNASKLAMSETSNDGA